MLGGIMSAPPNHNGGPPLVERSFKKRWAQALFNHPGKKPMGSIAMAFLIYMRMDAKGEGAAIPDSEFMSHCGVSDGSVRVFKRWLVSQEFIRIKVRGHRGSCSEFQATIPAADAAIQASTPVADQPNIPAANAGIPEPDYRRPMPVVEIIPPATAAGIRQMAAGDAGIPSRAHARIETPSGLVISQKVEDKSPLTPLRFEDPYDRATIENGKLVLFNGLRQEWLEKFGGDEETLDLALIEISADIQPNSRKSMEAQVSARLARMARDARDKDKRYAKAVERNKRAASPQAGGETSYDRTSRFVDKALQNLTPKQGKLLP
jgi:hypothetical protein